VTKLAMAGGGMVVDYRRGDFPPMNHGLTVIGPLERLDWL